MYPKKPSLQLFHLRVLSPRNLFDPGFTWEFHKPKYSLHQIAFLSLIPLYFAHPVSPVKSLIEIWNDWVREEQNVGRVSKVMCHRRGWRD